MPYFHQPPATGAYWCPNCRGWFYPSLVKCGVIHQPGQCCHIGERRKDDSPQTCEGKTIPPKPDFIRGTGESK